MEREHMPHPQMNFYRQNYLYNQPPALGESNSQFLHHNTSGRFYNFLPSMPTYNHTSGPQGYGSSTAIHNLNPSVQEGYTSFACHPPTRHQIPHVQRNFDGSHQRCPSNGPSTIGHNNSHLPNHGISRSSHYFQCHMSNNQNGMMSNYAPQQASHNHNPSIQHNSYSSLAASQPGQYLVEQHSVIEEEISITWKFIELAQISFSHGNSAHEGLMETREMRRMPYPEFEWNGFVDSNMHPSYSGNYQIHPNQQLQHMQPMRGNNLNLQHQMPSASPHWHEMDNPQTLHSSHSSWGSSADTRNRHSESSMLVDQMHHQENILLEDYMLAHYRSTIRRVDDVVLLDAFDVDAYLHELSSFEGPTNREEQMGRASTGLSEEEIQRHLMKRTHLSSANQFNLNEAPPSKQSRISVNKLDLNEACSDSDEEPDICVICQVEYESQERIGTLECGHEYHADCITKWLQEKNVCPVCKATALSIKS